MKIKASTLLELAVNLLLPWVAYRMALPHWDEVGALYASAVPPLAWAVGQFALSRRIDAVSVLVLLGIVLSIAMMAWEGDARSLLLRESLVSGAIGVAFLVSLAFRRPLVFYLARATMGREEAGGVERFEALWRERPLLRTALRTMTLVWGAGLTAEMLLRCWLVWHWPVERVVAIAPVLGYGIYGVLMLWTFWYRLRLSRQHGP